MGDHKKNIERDKEIVKLAKSGMKRGEIAKKFCLNADVISKVCVKAGFYFQKRPSTELKKEVAKYRSRNPLNKTAEKYGISKTAVIGYYEKYGPDAEEKTHTVRVLKSVPDNFVAPTRGIGW